MPTTQRFIPRRPLKPCAKPGCGETVPKGFCAAHQKQRYQRQDERRGTPAQRGYDKDWQVVRVQAFVRDGWRCVDCGWEPDIVRLFRQSGLGLPPTASVLQELRYNAVRKEQHLHGDHIETIEQRPDLRLVVGNVATRCKSCHSAKTMRESVSNGRE